MYTYTYNNDNNKQCNLPNKQCNLLNARAF